MPGPHVAPYHCVSVCTAHERDTSLVWWRENQTGVAFMRLGVSSPALAVAVGHAVPASPRAATYSAARAAARVLVVRELDTTVVRSWSGNRGVEFMDDGVSDEKPAQRRNITILVRVRIRRSV